MDKKANYFSKFLFNYLLILINLSLAELVFRILSGFEIFDWASLRILIGLNVVAILFSSLVSLLNERFSRIASILIVLVFSLYTCAQIGFVNYLGVYISFGASSQLGAVEDYLIEFLSSFHWTYWLIFTSLVLTTILLIVFRKKIKYPSFSKKSAFYMIFVSIALIVFSLTYKYTITANFMQNSLQQVSNLELVKNPSAPSIVIKEFGTIGYGVLDIKALIVPVQVEEDEPEIVEEPKEEKPEEITDNSRIIDDRAWKETIQNEKNSTFNNLNKYFINRDITDKNDYTGLFEGKNLIVIMMESVNDIIINEEYYPNFYKLYSEGWHFSNNYSPRNSCATGNNEMSGMISLYSINDSCTANKYKANTYYEAIFNLFNNSGYETTSMHNYTESYYRRSTIHPNMGSKKYYGVQSLKIPFYYEYGKWASDEDFFKKVLTILDKYEENTKFMTWLTTVSSHQPYSISSPYGDMYLSEFKDTKYNSTTKRYMSKLKVLDNALGILIKGLEERNLLDDTIIVLFADHYPYGLAKTNIEKVLGYNVAKDSLSDKTPFVIYNPSLKPTEYEQYTTYMNLTPTIANLFNLNYDPRLYLGHDVLADDYESRIVFADGSWKNEHAYYNAANSKITNYDDYYTVEDIKKINSSLTTDMKMSALAIKNNYFAYLNNSLKRYKPAEPEENEAQMVEAEVITAKVENEQLSSTDAQDN